MRTTIEIDDQLYREIKLRARSSSRTIREVVETALRAAFLRKNEKKSRFKVRPHDSAFKAGIDENHVRQILDEIEIEDRQRRGEFQ